jgi:hypothetical protein
LRTLATFLITLSALALGACSSVRQHTLPDDANLLSGAGSIAVSRGEPGLSRDGPEAFELIDVGQLLEVYGLENPREVSAQQLAEVEQFKYRRNDLQDRLIAASNQRCGAYLRMLTSSRSQTRMAWGGLAALLSGAASVTTPGSAARVLSAGSTVSGSVLSLYDEAYFSNLTLNVISAGIAKTREGVLRNISEQRDESLSRYPVNRAIADALAYHAACNVVSGLEAAAAATKSADSRDIAPALR